MHPHPLNPHCGAPGEGCDPSLMDADQLKFVFGERAAEAQNVIFQHTSRITQEAEFQDETSMFKVTVKERGHPKNYRKAQRAVSTQPTAPTISSKIAVQQWQQ